MRSHLALAGLPAALLLTVAGSVAGPDPPAATTTAAADRGFVRAAGTHFALHSHALVNLHHFLYSWAAHDAVEAAGRRPWVPVAERADLAELDAAAAAAWSAAVSFYREHLMDRDLLRDREMWEAGTRLAEAGSLQGVVDGGLPSGWVATLRGVAAIYAHHWWPVHDAANRAWIERAAAAMERVEDRVALDLVAVYGGAWSAGPVRVDVSRYANRVGAYTGDEPVRITIASSDPDHDGWGAVETLLHEVSHTDDVAGSYRLDLIAACEDEGVEPDRDLWHTVIFYSAGELTRQALAEDGIEYVPYLERSGLMARSAGTRRAAGVLADTWPSLRAAGDAPARSRALRRYVRAFAVAAPSGAGEPPAGDLPPGR